MIRSLIAAAFVCAAASIGAAPVASADVYFANCTEARAAGVTPLMEGDPGYAPHLDRDRDGIARE
jgi:Excalibur calcium-binding domain